MSIFDDWTDRPADDPSLADDRREWLRGHPAWTIDNEGYVLSLLDSVGREWEALASYPGPLWLIAQGAQLDAGTLVRIGGLPGLTGLQLWKSNIGDAEFILFAEVARGLAHFTLYDDGGMTDRGLRHLAELPNLESLRLFFRGLFLRNDYSPDTAFLEKLAGDRSPKAFTFDSADAFADSDLDRIAGWSNLEECSLSLAAGVRDDFPWLAGMEKMRRLDLNCDGPLTPAGLARLGGLGALTKLELTADSLDPEGVRHLAALENLAELTLYTKKGPRPVSAAFVGHKNLLSLRIGGNSAGSDEITTADLANFASMPKLETLLIGEDVNRESDFSVLSAAPSLKEADLNSFDMNPTDSVLEKLSEIRGLAKLELWGDNYTGRGLASFAALPDLAELEIFDLGKLDESDLACLADFPALTGLTLAFEGNRGLPMRRFSFLGNIGKLKSFRVCDRGEWNAAMIEDITAATGLKSLTLEGLRDLSAAWLEALGRLPALEEIVLDHCRELRNVDFLGEIGTLRRITIRDCDNIPVKALLSLRNLPLEEINVGRLRHFSPMPNQEFVALRLAWPEARAY